MPYNYINIICKDLSFILYLNASDFVQHLITQSNRL